MKKIISIFLLAILTVGTAKYAYAKAKKQVPLVLAPVEYTLKPYNYSPGKLESNLLKLKTNKVITSAGVVSPDYQKMAFVQTGFLPSLNQIVPFLFYLNLDTNKSEIERVKTARINDKIEIPLENVRIERQVFRTFDIVDWSENSQELLIKECIGENQRNLWQTNIWIYDFTTQKARQLPELKKAIAFYWRTSRSLNLNKYTWDLTPLGWDGNHPGRIIVKAFGVAKDHKRFLGLWSIDEQGENPYLLALKEPDFYNIAANGLVLKRKKN